MKLLLYNWAQFDNEVRLGGGVSIYLKRLIPELVKQCVEVVFLSVGSDASKQLKIEQVKNCFDRLGVKSYKLFNSSIPYPHRQAFGADELLENTEVSGVLGEFVKQIRPDVVNFHSIEGLPASALRLKETFPDIKWWFTAHNYHLICQQIQLFQKRHNRNCRDFLQGHACRTCQWQDFDNISSADMLVHRLPWIKNPLNALEFLRRGLSRFRRSSENALPTDRERVDAAWLNREAVKNAEYFFDWRSYNMETMSLHLDGIIAVSKMQKALLCEAGVSKERLYVLSPAVSEQRAVKKASATKAISTVSYWGYSNPGTGLSLFLDSLELMAHSYSATKSISVLVVSDIGLRFRDRLALLAPHFNKIEVIKRYDHDNMKSIAATTDLAVIGPILQETYCQVAAELYDLGVPVLASSTLGFADEHINDERFIFESGVEADLVKRLICLIEKPEALTSYWETTSVPALLSEHAQEMVSLYQQAKPAESTK